MARVKAEKLTEEQAPVEPARPIWTEHELLKPLNYQGAIVPKGETVMLDPDQVKTCREHGIIK